MTLKIGTRKSRLALAQTELVQNALHAKFPEIQTEIVEITTRGDKILDCPLEEIGGKGVFVGEIETALQSGIIDLAVHSAKDLPVVLGEDLEISGVLPRGNYRDMLIAKNRVKFGRDDVFTVGTGSLRRRENLLKLYPNARFADIRGNVDTRLHKLRNGEYDALILCAAGLERLGIPLDEFSVEVFEHTEFLPAPCQGIIAVECAKNGTAAQIINAVSDTDTMICFEAEREIIRLLGADCSTPLGAFSEIRGDKIFIALSDSNLKSVSGSAEIFEKSRLIKELIEKL